MSVGGHLLQEGVVAAERHRSKQATSADITHARSARCRARRLALLAACLLLVVIPPGVALAAQFDYASGVNGAGGTFATSGETWRNYNQVWHQAGKSWWVWYLHGSTLTGLVYNSSNPTQYGGASSTIAYAKCSNDDDNSGVTWTCQTTRP